MVSPYHTDDYLTWDNVETVSYFSQTSIGAYCETYDVTAKPMAVTERERAPTAGVYAGADLNWIIPGIFLADDEVTPKMGDYISRPAVSEYDDPTEWTVISVEHRRTNDHYLCSCVNLAIYHDLRDLVTFYKPDGGDDLRDAAASYDPVFATETALTNLKCRIQEQSGEFNESRGMRGTTRRFTIFLAAPLTSITTDWYAQDASGNKYDIERWTNKQSITDLMQIEATLRV